MKDKLLLGVRLPATLESYQFLMPYDLAVEEGAQLAASILAAREPARYEMTPDVELMYLEGSSAGVVINPRETFRSLVLQGSLVEGSEVMLV